MNTEGLDQALRPYLLLFMKLLLESPVQRNCLIEESTLDTVTTSSGIGLESNSPFSCGSYCHVAMLTMQVEPRKYETVVKSIVEILNTCVFNSERVRSAATNMLDGITGVKADVLSILPAIPRFMLYSHESNVRVFSVLNHEKFLAALLKNLNYFDRATSILNDLDAMRVFLTKRENLSLHIATNITDRAKESVNLGKVWGEICQKNDDNFKNELRVIPDWKEMNYKGFGLKDGVNGTVVGMGTTESAFLYHVVESIKDYLSPDLPALRLYLQYLNQFEGPIWNVIRGNGLAYASTMILQPYEGLLIFVVHRASKIIAAFKEAKRVVETHLQSNSWDESLLESAKSSLIFKVIEKERNLGLLVSGASSLSYMMVPPNYNQMLVKEISKVTKAQLQNVGKKYVSRLFSETAKTAIVCNPDKVKEVTEGFEAMNIILSGACSVDESILNN